MTVISRQRKIHCKQSATTLNNFGADLRPIQMGGLCLTSTTLSFSTSFPIMGDHQGGLESFCMHSLSPASPGVTHARSAATINFTAQSTDVYDNEHKAGSMPSFYASPALPVY